MAGNNVSHANNKTKRRFLPNLQAKKCWSVRLKRFFNLKLSVSALRTVDKLGLDHYASKIGFVHNSNF